MDLHRALKIAENENARLRLALSKLIVAIGVVTPTRSNEAGIEVEEYTIKTSEIYELAEKAESAIKLFDTAKFTRFIHLLGCNSDHYTQKDWGELNQLYAHFLPLILSKFADPEVDKTIRRKFGR